MPFIDTDGNTVKNDCKHVILLVLPFTCLANRHRLPVIEDIVTLAIGICDWLYTVIRLCQHLQDRLPTTRSQFLEAYFHWKHSTFSYLRNIALCCEDLQHALDITNFITAADADLLEERRKYYSSIVEAFSKIAVFSRHIMLNTDHLFALCSNYERKYGCYT